MEKKPLETAIQGSRSPMTNKTIVLINVQGYKEERTCYAANLRNWDSILGEPALKKLKAFMNIYDNMIIIQPPGMARYDLIMLQKTGNDSIRSAAMWMQPTCETASESSAQPDSDVKYNRTSYSESIQDYAYNKKDYEDSSDNESITNMHAQLRQLEEESRSLDKQLRQLEGESRSWDEQLRQQAKIHLWLDYKFDELMNSMKSERRRILVQDAQYNIWEEEEEINPESWETWSDSEYEP